MEFRHIKLENEVTVRGDASQWLGEATMRNGIKAYEIRAGETVFGMGFRSYIQMLTQTVGVKNHIVDQAFDKRATPLQQVHGAKNTWSEDFLVRAVEVHNEVVIRADGVDHIQSAIEVLLRRTPTALILTDSEARAKQWITALKKAGKKSVPVASKSACDYDFISVCTVSDYLSELGGNPHGWDGLNLDPGMLIVDQCELIAAHDLKRAARSIRPAFRLGVMESPPEDVSAMQRLCHEMGPWILGRPKHAHEFRWNSPL